MEQPRRRRGPRRFTYTYDDLERVTGLARSTLVSDGSSNAQLEHVVSRAANAWAGRSRRIDPAAGWDARDVELWQGRWPVVDLYACGAPGCNGVLLQRGLCPDHGGGWPALAFNYARYICIRLGTLYVPLHRVLCPAPPGHDVHHVDENRWNNRPWNLRPMPHAEHMLLHHEGWNGKRRRAAAVDATGASPTESAVDVPANVTRRTCDR